MTKDEAKVQVSALLLERAEMKRLGLELSPDKLMLLKRLMYQLGMNNVKLQRRENLLRLARRLGVKRYAKVDSHVVPHPLVAGFPLENFLRSLANDPENHPTIRELAKVAVTGGKNGDASNVPTALWALHDELHEKKHPHAEAYNLMSAADAVGLDAHTYRAAKEIHEDQERRRARPDANGAAEWWERTPEAVLHMASSAYHTDKSRGSYASRTAEAVKSRIHARVKELAPGIGDDEIRKSIKRHAYRANKVWRDQAATLTPEEEHEHFGKRDIGPFKPRNKNIPQGLIEAEQATRYSRLLRKLARRTGVIRLARSTPESIKALEQAVLANPNDASIRHALADEYEESGDEWKVKNAHELREATGTGLTAFQAYDRTPVILRKVVRGRQYAAHAPDEVIRILQSLEGTPRRVHVHSGYMFGPKAGQDWLEENDVQGRIGVSRGPGGTADAGGLTQLIFGRGHYGSSVDAGHVVRIRDLQTGQDLYRHPQYHHGKIEIRQHAKPITISPRAMKTGDMAHYPALTHGVFRDGNNIANFKDEASARKWTNKMGLTLHDPNNSYQGKLSRNRLSNYLKRYQMVAGDFLDALRRIRSSDQHAIKRSMEEIAAKLGAKPASTISALHDSPTYSVPGVAMAIYSNLAPEKVQALAAWAGLTQNTPGQAVFHVRPDGPDMLHRFRMHGSGHELRERLNKAGLDSRILAPHRQGFDVMIPDKNGAMKDRVKAFTQQQKVELQSSRGHFRTIGSSDQARAREMFRNTITKQEQSSPPQQSERPTLKNRIKGMLIRMARSTPESIDKLIEAVDDNPNDHSLRHALAEELEELPDNGWYNEMHYPNRAEWAKNLRDPNARVGAHQVVRDNINLNNQMGSSMGGDGPLPSHEHGYPLVYLTHDNAALCHNCVNSHIRRIADEIKNPDWHDHFRVKAYAPNYENDDLTCDHCGNQIESAYGG